MTVDTLGLLVIATGRYMNFAEQLIRDAVAQLTTGSVTVNLFTDADPRDVKARLSNKTVSINVLPVPALRWPEASLYRYELFTRASTQIEGDTLMYLDADLRIVKPFQGLIRPSSWPSQMAAVRHPGYYKRGLRGPKGPWESRGESSARVSALRRRSYVCGGVWAGSRMAVLDVSATLAHRVEHDRLNGVTAVWHDESHWNWWVAHHRVKLLDPRFCWVPDYPHLAHLDPCIIAVDKGADFEREDTGNEARDQLLGPSAVLGQASPPDRLS